GAVEDGQRRGGHSGGRGHNSSASHPGAQPATEPGLLVGGNFTQKGLKTGPDVGR
ncbi:MAG: hypothetical protein RLZ97_1736, partial [Verrucomicrobiota bacterium]